MAYTTLNKMVTVFINNYYYWCLVVLSAPQQRHSRIMSVSQIICPPAKSVTGKSQPEFNAKQLFRVIQGHSFEGHGKVVKGL